MQPGRSDLGPSPSLPPRPRSPAAHPAPHGPLGSPTVGEEAPSSARLHHLLGHHPGVELGGLWGCLDEWWRDTERDPSVVLKGNHRCHSANHFANVAAVLSWFHTGLEMNPDSPRGV